MKRRDFLKRAVGVIAGAVIAPTVIKAKTSCSASASIPSSAEPSVEPKYPFGTRRVVADGRVYRYVGNESGYINKGSFAFNRSEVVGGRIENGWMQTKGIMDVYLLRYEGKNK